jgi:hypothetical protein
MVGPLPMIDRIGGPVLAFAVIGSRRTLEKRFPVSRGIGNKLLTIYEGHKSEEDIKLPSCAYELCAVS